MPLTPTIEALNAETDPALHVVLGVTNQSDRGIALLNPDMGVPAPSMNWPWSNETYQTSLLISFGYLSISLNDETGQELPQQAIQAWATPVLRPKLNLAPGDSFKLAVPIGKFYHLTSGKRYWVALEYGDQDLKISARTLVTAP